MVGKLDQSHHYQVIYVAQGVALETIKNLQDLEEVTSSSL